MDGLCSRLVQGSFDDPFDGLLANCYYVTKLLNEDDLEIKHPIFN